MMSMSTYLVKLLDRRGKEFKSNKKDVSERLDTSSIYKDIVLAGFFWYIDPPDQRGSTGPLTS